MELYEALIIRMKLYVTYTYNRDTYNIIHMDPVAWLNKEHEPGQAKG